MDILTLFIIGIIIAFFLALGFFIGKRIGKMQSNRFWQEQIPSIREDARTRSRAVLKGQFSEQLAPFLPDFPYHPSEVKFLGKPVDLVVFKGLDNKKIEEVIFVEVKTGKSRLTTTEKSLEQAVARKKVSFKTYRVNLPPDSE